MKNKLYPALFVVVAVTCLLGWDGYGQSRAPEVQAWEYKVLHAPVDERQINDFGAQGWELVAASEDLSLQGGNGRSHVTVYLKRPR